MRRITMIIALALTACSTLPPTTSEPGGSAAVSAPDVASAPGERQQKSVDAATRTEFDAAGGAVVAAQPDADVWKRIQSGLVLARHSDQKSVQAKLAWFKRNQAFLDRVAERARPYLFYIVQELERRGMPSDLALLPIIESAYHPFAYSPSRASGIWQFIPSTGKRYGLKQNFWYDGRRDIVAATQAALDYLQRLHKEFNSDWLLAVAAYNAGELNVARAVSRNKNSGGNTDFWSLQLPKETRGYVPSLLAVAELIADPDRHGVTWQPIPNASYFARVELNGQLDLATAAELAEITMDELYTLNPGFNQWATDPDGPHYLLIPASKVEGFMGSLAGLPEGERVQWTRHEILTGETLGGIATHYHVSVEALKQANDLRTSLIRAGQSLLIPNAQQSPNHYTLSVDNRRFRGLKRAATGDRLIYTVSRGDTLWDIGRQYGVSVNDLCAWNGISSRSLLRLGQELELWLDRQEAAAMPVSLEATSTTQPITYTVQKGDSLWMISRRFGVSVAQLLQWNSLREGNRLQPGQTLVLYRPDIPPTGA